MKLLFISAVVVCGISVTGCSMLTVWKSIPPPGGCDQCHTVAISTDWKISYQAANLTDERNREAFQTPQYTMPSTGQSAQSSLELRKNQDMQCFECHKSPNSEHRNRSGKFHH